MTGPYGCGPSVFDAEKAARMTAEMFELRKEYSEILEHTLRFDDKLPWEALMVKEDYPDFIFQLKKPEMPDIKKKSFLGVNFGTAKNSEKNNAYISELNDYINSKTFALVEYIAEREKFERSKLKTNSEISCLQYYFEKCEKSAVQHYAEMVLQRSQYPKRFSRSYKLDYDESVKTLTVSCLMPCFDDFPNVEAYRYNDKLNKLEWKLIEYSSAVAFYEHTLLTVCLRTLHELFEGIYTGAVEYIIFNGYVRNKKYSQSLKQSEAKVCPELGAETNNNIRCVFAVKTNKKMFQDIKIENKRTEKILEGLGLQRVEAFSDIMQVMAPLTAEEEV